MNKPIENKPKPKEFTITSEEISELSFIRQTLRVFEETLFYWQNRWEAKIDGVLKRLALNRDDYTIDLSQLWTRSKIYAVKKPKPVVVPEQTNESKLPEKQEPGTTPSK